MNQNFTPIYMIYTIPLICQLIKHMCSSPSLEQHNKHKTVKHEVLGTCTTEPCRCPTAMMLYKSDLIHVNTAHCLKLLIAAVLFLDMTSYRRIPGH
jgi:hypothetical protein